MNLNYYSIICFFQSVIPLVFILISTKPYAQNLVKNPGFEDYIYCPGTYGTFEDDVLFWKQPTIGSTDYFNNCSTSMPVNRNFIGIQETYEGNAYAGLYVYGPKDYREYIAGELEEKLVKGKKYIFSFKVSLADKCEIAIDQFGILFSHKSLNLRTKRNIPYHLMNRNGLYNYVTIRDRSFFDNKGSWTEIKGEYIADGTEQFVIIGNFNQNSTTRIKTVASNQKKAAYYYIDMVSVVPAEKAFKLDEIYVLKNLLFDVNGSTIKKGAENRLLSLITHLKENPGLNISIYGHTDNVGSDSYNRELSQKRAKAVGLFLVENGLAPSRIAWRGFGDLSPIADNDSETGREKNRRVEFVLSKKKREFYATGLFEDEE